MCSRSPAQDNTSVTGRWSFFPDKHAIAPRIQAPGVRKYGSPVRNAVRDVIDERAAGGIEIQLVARALRDLMIRARRVTTDTEAADQPGSPVDRDAAAEEDQSATDLVVSPSLAAGRRGERRVPQIRLTEAPQ